MINYARGIRRMWANTARAHVHRKPCPLQTRDGDGLELRTTWCWSAFAAGAWAGRKRPLLGKHCADALPRARSCAGRSAGAWAVSRASGASEDFSLSGCLGTLHRPKRSGGRRYRGQFRRCSAGAVISAARDGRPRGRLRSRQLLAWLGNGMVPLDPCRVRPAGAAPSATHSGVVAEPGRTDGAAGAVVGPSRSPQSPAGPERVDGHSRDRCLRRDAARTCARSVAGGDVDAAGSSDDRLGSAGSALAAPASTSRPGGLPYRASALVRPMRPLPAVGSPEGGDRGHSGDGAGVRRGGWTCDYRASRHAGFGIFALPSQSGKRIQPRNVPYRP